MFYLNRSIGTNWDPKYIYVVLVCWSHSSIKLSALPLTELQKCLFEKRHSCIECISHVLLSHTGPSNGDWHISFFFFLNLRFTEYSHILAVNAPTAWVSVSAAHTALSPPLGETRLNAQSVAEPDGWSVVGGSWAKEAASAQSIADPCISH